MFKNFKIDNMKYKDFETFDGIATIDNSRYGYIRNMLIKGSSVQNGTPTPENPVPISSVPSEFDITVCGENQWNSEEMFNTISALQPDTTYFEFLTFDDRRCAKVRAPNSAIRATQFRYGFKPDTQYRIKYDAYNYEATPLPESFGVYIRIYYTDNSVTNTSAAYTRNEWVNVNVLSTAGKTIDYIGMTFGNVEVGVYYDLDTFSITESFDDLPYEQYKGETTPITIKDNRGLGADSLHELRSLPDGTADAVDLQSGKIKIHTKVLEYSYPQTYGGSNGWSITTGDSEKVLFFRIERREGTPVVGTYWSSGYCSHFNFIPRWNTDVGNTYCELRTSEGYNIHYTLFAVSRDTIGVSEEADIAEVRTAGISWLNNLLQESGPLKYVVEEFEQYKQSIDLDSSQAEALKSLTTFKSERSYVFTDAETPPKIEFKAHAGEQNV